MRGAPPSQVYFEHGCRRPFDPPPIADFLASMLKSVLELIRCVYSLPRFASVLNLASMVQPEGG